MHVAHEKLQGLDRDRLLAAVEPVLRAHNVEGVEIAWKTDHAGRVLALTIERPGSRVPGEGVTIDLCTEISRDLSAALDVAEVMPAAYRLEVGSPGLDRPLYQARDYQRFAGQNAKLKLTQPVDGQHVLQGTLHGLDEASDDVLIETDRGVLSVALSAIDSARLVFDWGTSQGRPGKSKSGRRAAQRHPAARAHNKKSR